MYHDSGQHAPGRGCVVVKDKKGQAITGLKAEDFTVEENGKKQKIATFVPAGAEQTPAQPIPPGLLTNRPEYLKPAGVPTVLLVDAANSHFLDQAYGRNQMLKYVVEQSRTNMGTDGTFPEFPTRQRRTS